MANLNLEVFIKLMMMLMFKDMIMNESMPIVHVITQRNTNTHIRVNANNNAKVNSRTNICNHASNSIPFINEEFKYLKSQVA